MKSYNKADHDKSSERIEILKERRALTEVNGGIQQLLQTLDDRDLSNTFPNEAAGAVPDNPTQTMCPAPGGCKKEDEIQQQIDELWCMCPAPGCCKKKSD